MVESAEHVGGIRAVVDDEQSVANIVTEAWTRVLDVDPEPKDRDFFELGGNSLLALALIENIEAELDLQLDMVRFFTSSTLQDLVDQAGGAWRARGGRD
jgi:acyl carrier protein